MVGAGEVGDTFSILTSVAHKPTECTKLTLRLRCSLVVESLLGIQEVLSSSPGKEEARKQEDQGQSDLTKASLGYIMCFR